MWVKNTIRAIALIVVVGLIVCFFVIAKETDQSRIDSTAFNAARDGDDIKLRKMMTEGISPSVLQHAFVMSVDNSSPEMLKHELQMGVNPNALCGPELTPLAVCVGANNIRNAMILLDHGANVNTNSINLLPPLYMAAGAGYDEMTLLLIVRGASINYHDDKHETALFVAVKNNRVSTIKLLLSHGADPMIAANNKLLPVEVAREMGQKEIVAILKDAMAKRKAVGSGGSGTTKK